MDIGEIPKQPLGKSIPSLEAWPPATVRKATLPLFKAFKPILEAYVQEKGLKIYSIEINDLDEGNRELRKTLGATPAIGIFKSGELYEHVHYAQEDKGEVMLSKDSFASWFETYVIIK